MRNNVYKGLGLRSWRVVVFNYCEIRNGRTTFVDNSGLKPFVYGKHSCSLGCGETTPPLDQDHEQSAGGDIGSLGRLCRLHVADHASSSGGIWPRDDASS